MDTSLKSALQKAKRKQLLKVIIASIIAVLILLPILYKTGNFFAAKGASRLHHQLFLYHSIAQPNVQIDSQVTSSSSTLGGNITTNRSKNIHGYLVQWSTLTSSYDWLRNNIDHNELTPGFHSSDSGYFIYDKQTKNKVATFYHPSIQAYYDVPNELGGISQMNNQVAEVAISFDQPYTFKEIHAKIPGDLNIVWLYMASPIVDENKGPSGMPFYGFDPSDSPKDAYKSFLGALEEYDERGDNETIQAYLEENQNKQFDEVKVLGVMLTGRTENFKALENQAFIRGASVGATAQIVPYITPDK